MSRERPDRWRSARLGEAMVALARTSGLASSGVASSGWASPGSAAAGLATTDGLADRPAGADDAAWLEGYAARLGVEALPIRLTHRELSASLARTGPVLLRPLGDPDTIFAVVRSGSGRVRLLGPDGRRRSTSVHALRQALARPLEDARAAEVDELLADLSRAGTADGPRDALRRALLEERLGDRVCVEGWTLQPAAAASWWVQARNVGLLSCAAVVVVAHAARLLALVAAWTTLGRGVLEGSLDLGWLGAWVLLLMTTVPLAALEAWAESELAWRAGGLLKRRLLHGALRLDPDEVRGLGAGEMLGRVLDSERVESLALGGGFLALLAVVELAAAAAILALGAAPWLHGGLLALWLVALAVATAGFWLDRAAWTRARLQMTRRLVERLLGQRTRLAQEAPEDRHEAEDRELEAYGRLSSRLDRWAPRLRAAIPRGWLLAALAALVPAAASGSLDGTALVVSLGGILLALQGLRSTVGGLASLAAAGIAWREVGPIVRAASRPESLGAPIAPLEARRATARSTVLEARGLTFRHARRGDDAVRDASLALRRGDRVLLEGASGSGKSTLVSLLGARRTPRAGWLGLHGLDPDVWGDRSWRRRVACVPQFHDNHLLAAPLALNLLLGRGWPAGEDDLAEAAEVCRELGLGPLLERMPAGIMQPVGDSGWRLSHGERGRVFLARALLQRADVVVLDESLSGLDLETLERSLTCARERAPTLLVVAHP